MLVTRDRVPNMARFTHEPISEEEILSAIESGPTLARFARALQQTSRQLLFERILSIGEKAIGKRNTRNIHLYVWASVAREYRLLGPEDIRELEVLYEQAGGWWIIPEDPDEEPVFLDKQDWNSHVEMLRDGARRDAGEVPEPIVDDQDVEEAQ